MATRRDFGLAPEEPESRLPRRRYVIDDESGARPLPREDRDAYAVDPLDEEVELPGVSRERAGLWFGVGVGLGIVALAVAGGLYVGGYVGRAELAAGPEPVPLTTGNGALAEMLSDRALARARIAPVWIAERAPGFGVLEQESPDIQVIEEPEAAAEPAAPAAETKDPAPRRAPSSDARPSAVAGDDVSGEEMDVDGGVPAESKSDPNELSNELDRLQNSLTPRGPVAPPKPPSNDPSAPEAPMPPPAAPTAPAETIPPSSQ